MRASSLVVQNVQRWRLHHSTRPLRAFWFLLDSQKFPLEHGATVYRVSKWPWESSNPEHINYERHETWKLSERQMKLCCRKRSHVNTVISPEKIMYISTVYRIYVVGVGIVSYRRCQQRPAWQKGYFVFSFAPKIYKFIFISTEPSANWLAFVYGVYAMHTNYSCHLYIHRWCVCDLKRLIVSKCQLKTTISCSFRFCVCEPNRRHQAAFASDFNCMRCCMVPTTRISISDVRIAFVKFIFDKRQIKKLKNKIESSIPKCRRLDTGVQTTTYYLPTYTVHGVLWLILFILISCACFASSIPEQKWYLIKRRCTKVSRKFMCKRPRGTEHSTLSQWESKRVKETRNMTPTTERKRKNRRSIIILIN